MSWVSGKEGTRERGKNGGREERRKRRQEVKTYHEALLRYIFIRLPSLLTLSVTGPITVVAGKSKRITLFECPSDDLCAMLDLAKTADLVLLMVDGSFGFEMETFEFLNMLQVGSSLPPSLLPPFPPSLLSLFFYVLRSQSLRF